MVYGIMELQNNMFEAITEKIHTCFRFFSANQTSSIPYIKLIVFVVL